MNGHELHLGQLVDGVKKLKREALEMLNNDLILGCWKELENMSRLKGVIRLQKHYSGRS